MANEKVKQYILEVLTQHPCLTAKEIAFFIKKDHGGDLLSSQTISGILRPLHTQNIVGKCKNDTKVVYWLIGVDKERML